MGNGWKAAAGKVNITPEESAPLQGYNPEQYIANPETDVLDDLYAKIVILDGGGSRSVIVSLDCCLTNEEEAIVTGPRSPGTYRSFKGTLPGRYEAGLGGSGWRNDFIRYCCRNAHTYGPEHISPTYTSRIEAEIKRLADRLTPVKLSVSTGKSKLSAYRRPDLNPHFDVEVDQTLYVVSVEMENGLPLAQLVQYAVHPTLLRPPGRISSEFVGRAMEALEQEKGDGFISLFIQGFSGDICPSYGGNSATEDTYPLVVQAGVQLAADIREALQNKEPLHGSALLQYESTFALPTRRDYFTDDKEVTLNLLQIADHTVVVSISGEIFNGYVEKIRAISPYKHTLCVGLANGYSGYIPTIEAFQDGLGGYEMRTTPYIETTEEILLNEIRRAFQALQ